MNALMASRLKLEGKLRNALTNNEFKLNYQAQFDLNSGQTISAEALLRWHQPELGVVPPFEFIPIAEDTGLIIELGEWVLNEACRQNREWQDMGYEPIKISVNLSAIQFLQGNLLNVIKNILERNQLKPEFLELEITESTLMSNIEDTIKTLIDIKELGVSIAIDDFGTGYSSLSYLKRLPLDILKIDRSFIKDMPDDGDDTAITSAIIAMAHQLQLKVVAEGVETETQMNILRDFGCEIGQGYYYCKPIPAEEFEQHISKQTQAKSAFV
jgi:EAL domain-containing protein (putative c-di-GMP-specific phosphodiesterase class I)